MLYAILERKIVDRIWWCGGESIQRLHVFTVCRGTGIGLQDLLQSPCVEVGDVIHLAVFFPFGTLDVEIYFYFIAGIHPVNNRGFILHALKFNVVGDRSSPDVLGLLHHELPCFKSFGTLYGIVFRYQLAC